MEKEKTRFGKSGSIDFEEINKRMNKFIEEGDRKNLLDLNKNIKNKNCFVLLKEDERIELQNKINIALETKLFLEKKRTQPNFEELKERMDKFIEEGDKHNLQLLKNSIKNKNCFVLLKEDERIKLENALNTTLEMIKYTSEEKIEKNPILKMLNFF